MQAISILIVVITLAFVHWLSTQKTPWIKKLINWFPAILFAYVVPAIITHGFNLDLSQVTLHQWSKEWIIPLAILCVMSALSFRQLKMIGSRPILLFVSGSLAIATLPVILVWLSGLFSPQAHGIFIEQVYWKGLVPIVGGWIGGSTSQLVLKELAETPEGMFLSVLVLDNILVNIWTILMFQLIQRSDVLNRWFGINDPMPDFVPDQAQPSQRTWQAITVTLGLIILIAGLSKWFIPSFLWKVVILSFVGLALGNFIKNWNHSLVLKAGGFLIVTIMAILGLKLSFSNMTLPWFFVLIVIVWLLLHYLVMIVVARLLKVHMAWVPIASMANLGGISTAPAVTAAYNEEWMPHAILLAILSMVTGTAWGMFTIYLFGLF
ncbi:MAG: DUF819 family protein [Cyclobacteriaceae bacterium]|nr:DUF819 family protein [Cyclobacteriaceae bacterium]